MISALSVVLLSLQAGPLQATVAVEAPDARVVQAFVRAKRDLRQLPGNVEITTLARNAIGMIDPAMPLRVTLLTLYSTWTTRADTALLRERWPEARAAFNLSAAEAAPDPGIWLATLDAALGISRAMQDAQTDSLARSLYATAEARLAQRTSLYGLAFGLYEDEKADTLLISMLPIARAFWPLGNGLVALGLYEYHRDSTAFTIVQDMVHRDDFTPPMFVLPLIRGLIGWETDAANRAAALEPHLPATWSWLNVSNLPVGTDQMDVTIRRDRNSYNIYLQRRGPGRQISLRIAPALPAGSRIRSVTVNEHDVPVHVESSAHDVHVVVELTLREEAHIDIEFEPPLRKRASIR